MYKPVGRPLESRREFIFYVLLQSQTTVTKIRSVKSNCPPLPIGTLWTVYCRRRNGGPLSVIPDGLMKLSVS